MEGEATTLPFRRRWVAGSLPPAPAALRSYALKRSLLASTVPMAARVLRLVVIPTETACSRVMRSRAASTSAQARRGREVYPVRWGQADRTESRPWCAWWPKHQADTARPAGPKLMSGPTPTGMGAWMRQRLYPRHTSCNGTVGPTGAAGATGAAGGGGLSTLVSLTAESAGAHCSYGGTRVDAGLDGDSNGALSASEFTGTSYVCNGPPGPGISWINVTSTSVTAAPNTGYLANNSAEVAITLPPTPSVGDIVRVSGVGVGGWKLVQNAGQWLATTGLPGNVEPGNDWAPRDGQRAWNSVAMSVDGQRMVAADYTRLLYTSTDAGLNWTARDAQRNWFGVASSADGTRLIAAERNGFLYRSNDSGVTWQPTATVQNWEKVASSSDGSKLAATVNGGFIYVSSDFGQTWTATASSQNWKGIAISADGNRLYATGYYIPVYASADGGVTWTSAGPSLDFNQIGTSADGRQVVAAAWNDQLYVSQDYGATWTGHETARQWIGVASSADGARLLAGDYQGLLYVSADHGQTWRGEGSAQKWVTMASSASGDVLAAAAYDTRMFVSYGISKTATGSPGSVSGPQGATIELQYSGAGRFDVLSNNAPRGGFTIR